MRNALLGSAGLHVALLAALMFTVHSGRTVRLPGTDVVEVSLVGAVPDVAPEPKAAPAPEQVAPSEEQGIRLERTPKPKPAPAPRENAKSSKNAPVQQAAPTRTTLPMTSLGGGMRGELAVDGDFAFAYYLQQIRARIAANWAAPAGSSGGTSAEVYFRIARDGTVSEPRIETASGNGYFDQTTLRAVIVTGRLAPLPAGYKGDDLGVHFRFEFTGP